MQDTSEAATVTRTIPGPDIAAHWDVDPSYVRRLRLRPENRLPEFEDLGADHPDRFKLADAWRALHAPPRRRRILADAPDAPAGKSSGAGGGGGSSAPNNPPAAPALTFTEKEIEAERDRIGDDFAGWAVRAVEVAALMARRKYTEAMQSGDPVRVANALTSLNDTLRRAREQREAWLKLQERERRVISIDRAQDLLGDVLNALERRLKVMGRRVGPDANPADPERAAKAVDAEVDLICSQMAAALQALEEAKLSDAEAAGTEAPPAAA